MTEQIWPVHTPVSHSREGYIGWIHATTRMKEIFTGDTSVAWQYTIRVEGSDQMKVAPASDLVWIQTKAPFPAYVMYKETVSDKNYLQETRLHALGYRISDLNSEERWEILKFVAIPMLGAKEVVRTIMAVVLSRIARPVNADKFRHAFKEWNRDLNVIASVSRDTDDFTAVKSSVSYIQQKLVDLKMIEIKDVFHHDGV